MSVKEAAFEKELVLALKNKEPIGMQTLYNKYHRVLLDLISQIVKDEEPADILQIVLIKIWNTIGLYNSDKGRFFAWMIHVARNCALDVLRSKAYGNKRKCQHIDNCLEFIERKRNTTLNTDTIGLRDMINKMEPRFKEVIDLIYFNGFTHMEAAKELNMKLGTVKTRVRYAIEEIRKEFREQIIYFPRK